MTNRRSMSAAALLVALAGAAAQGQVTVNGKIDPSETGLYGAAKWVQNIPTQFGDNLAGAGGGAPDVGMPAAVSSGIEIAIPYAALAPYAGTGSIKVLVFINGQSHDFVSNQFLGGNATQGGLPTNSHPATNPRLLNLATEFMGDQFLLVTPTAAQVDPVIDGLLDNPLTNPNTAYGPVRITQSTGTDFGDATHGELVRRTGAGSDGSELDNIRVSRRSATSTLHIFIGGNLEANFNKLEIFIDSNPLEGQNRLLSNNPAGLTNMSDDGSGIGLTFDTGFSPDYWLSITGGNTALEGDPENNQVFVDYATLPAVGGGTGFFCGGTTYGSNGVLSGGDLDAPAIRATINNTNIEGVPGGDVGDANAAPNRDRAYGSELDSVYSYLDVANNKLFVLVTGNLQLNYNKIDLFLDAAPGGQNRLRGDSQLIVVGTDEVRYVGNCNAEFNGFNRMGATLENLIISDPENLLSARLPGDGLTFDTGFEADYWISYTNGPGGQNSVQQFSNTAILRTDGRNQNFSGNSLDFAGYDGGLKADNDPVPFDGPLFNEADRGGIADAQGLGAQYAPRHINDAIPDLFAPTAGLLRLSMDNTNVGGVTATEATDAVNVTTGLEFEIDLRELGWDGVSDIKLAGFINGDGHSFISNQVLGGLPSGPSSGGGYDATNIGEPRTANFANITGDQFVTLFTNDTGGCPLDFNNDGFVEPGDLDEFITSFFSDVPEERNRCDFNGDGFVEPGDLDEFITGFFEGC
ncbi:MAG: EF-hand domain-containing protein [Phycisphaerales bacterium]